MLDFLEHATCCTLLNSVAPGYSDSGGRARYVQEDNWRRLDRKLDCGGSKEQPIVGSNHGLEFLLVGGHREAFGKDRVCPVGFG